MKTSHLLLSILASALALAGCGSPPQPGLSAALGSPTASARQGGTAQFGLTLTPQNGLTGTVSLALVGAPQGVSLSPASVAVAGKAPVQQNLTLTVAASVAVGTYRPTLELSLGKLKQSLPFTLNVTAPPAPPAPPAVSGFNADPAALPPSGGRVGLSWVASNASGFTLSVSPASGVTGLPSGPITATGAEATLPANAAASPVTYTFTLTATGAAGTTPVTATAQVSVGPVTTGSLTVNVGGLPPGTTGNVTVTGPNGFSQTLTQTATLTDLAPGTYALTPADVVTGRLNDFVTGVRHRAVGASAVVSAGQTAAAAVTYAQDAPVMRGLVTSKTHLTSGDSSFLVKWAAANATAFRLEITPSAGVRVDGQPYTGPVTLFGVGTTINVPPAVGFDVTYTVSVTALGAGADGRAVQVFQLQSGARAFLGEFEESGSISTVVAQRGTPFNARVLVQGRDGFPLTDGKGTVSFSAVGPQIAPSPEDLAEMLGFPRTKAFQTTGGVVSLFFPVTVPPSVAPGFYIVTLTTTPDDAASARPTTSSFILLVK